MTSRMRLGAVALAVLALSPGGLAFADPADAPQRLKPLTSLGGAWLLPRDTSLLRPAGVHPVAAPVGYGEGGARFGADRGGRSHEGQDVFAPAGTPLLAVRDGIVLETGNDGGRGNYLAIWSPEARETYVYLHLLEAPLVSAGQRVRVGRRVGRLGCTGSCFGDHLHFEVRRDKTLAGPPRDPLPLLRRLPRA